MRVLLATDGSETALRACRMAANLVVPGRDEVRILTVLSYHLYPHSLVPGEHMADEREAAVREREEVDRLTAEVQAIFQKAGVAVDVFRRFGNAGDEILDGIHDWVPDIVVMGRRGVRGLKRWIGSVSEHVLHHAKIPVLLVP